MSQLVGKPCAVCGARIVTQMGALSCPACDAPFHKECVSDPFECPACKGQGQPDRSKGSAPGVSVSELVVRMILAAAVASAAGSLVFYQAFQWLFHDLFEEEPHLTPTFGRLFPLLFVIFLVLYLPKALRRRKKAGP